MPAAASSGSRPARVSRQPARAARAREPVVLDGGVAELAAEPAVAAEQLAAEHEPAADPDLARAVHEVADAGGRALPQLGERGEVGLVVEPDLQVRRGDAFPQLLHERDIAPVQVRRDQELAAGDVHQAGHRDRGADRPQTLRLDLQQRAARELAEPVQDLVDAAAAVVGRLHGLVARTAREVGGLDGDVVDVDLQPERHDAVAGDVHHEAGPAGGAAVLGAALHQQPEVHQLAHQAGDRALVEPGVGGDRGARAWPALDHLTQHDAQVVPPHGTLARKLDGRLRGPHEACNRIDGHGHQRSPTGGGDDPRRRRRRSGPARRPPRRP